MDAESPKKRVVLKVRHVTIVDMETPFWIDHTTLGLGVSSSLSSLSNSFSVEDVEDSLPEPSPASSVSAAETESPSPQSYIVQIPCGRRFFGKKECWVALERSHPRCSGRGKREHFQRPRL